MAQIRHRRTTVHGRRVADACCGALVLAAALLEPGQTASAAPGPPSKVPPIELVADESFEPRAAVESGPDWVQLSSGEWLSGTVERLRDGTLELDSDDLDDLALDLDDVYAVVTSGAHTLSVEDRDVLTGPLAIRGDVVRIRTEAGVESFARAEVIGIVAGEPREWNYWSGSVSVGVAYQRGNTDQSDLSALANLTRETAVTRSALRYNGATSAVRGVDTANNHRLNGQGDVFLTRRFYITYLAFEYYTDEFQNVDLRLVPAAGIGYALVEHPRASVDVELAGGASYTRVITPPPGSTVRDSTTAAVIFRTSFDTDPTERIEWDGEYKVQLGVPETSETFHHALTTISVEVWGDFDFDTTFVWDRNQSPSQRSDGTVPLRNDYRLTFGIGWDF